MVQALGTVELFSKVESLIPVVMFTEVEMFRKVGSLSMVETISTVELGTRRIGHKVGKVEKFSSWEILLFFQLHAASYLVHLLYICLMFYSAA